MTLNPNAWMDASDGMDEYVTSAGRQVTLCGPMARDVSSRSGVATLRTVIPFLLYLLCFTNVRGGRGRYPVT